MSDHIRVVNFRIKIYSKTTTISSVDGTNIYVWKIIQIFSAIYASSNGFTCWIFAFGCICYTSLIIGHTLIRKFQMNHVHSLESEQHKQYLSRWQIKVLHGVFMLICLAQLTGAGAAFTSRYLETASCNNFYCPEATDQGIQCYTDNAFDIIPEQQMSEIVNGTGSWVYFRIMYDVIAVLIGIIIIKKCEHRCNKNQTEENEDSVTQLSTAIEENET